MKAQNHRLHDVRKPKKQSSITSFIYKDPSTTTVTSTPVWGSWIKIISDTFSIQFVSIPTIDKAKQKRNDKQVQATLSIEEQLCGDDAGEEYWKGIAIEREKALNDTLEENRSLCELIQGT